MRGSNKQDSRIRNLALRTNRKCYSIKNATAKEAEIYLYDEIGFFGTSADDFVKDLAEITAETINVHINSPGGSVFDGMAMYSALKNHKARIVTHIDGLAASAATYPALAGDEVRMAKPAFFMIHDPLSIVFGNSGDMRKEAEILDKIRDSIASIYADRTGKSMEQVVQWMKDETWFNGTDAKANGFVDALFEDAPANNTFDLSMFNRVPEELAKAPNHNTNKIETIRDFENFLRDAGFSNAAAKRIASAGFKAKSEPRDEDDGLLTLIRDSVAANKKVLCPK